MFTACVTASFQLVLPSGSGPDPGPSVMCMVMVPFAHFEPSVAKPRVGSVARATSDQDGDDAEREAMAARHRTLALTADASSESRIGVIDRM